MNTPGFRDTLPAPAARTAAHDREWSHAHPSGPPDDAPAPARVLGGRGSGLMDLDLAEDLPSLLALERVDRDLFRGRNASHGPRRTLFGGQVRGAVPDRGRPDRRTGPSPPFVARILPPDRAQRPAGHPRGRPGQGRAVVLGPPRGRRAGGRGHLLHGHVVPRRERERPIRRRPPAAGPRPRGRCVRRLEPAARGAARSLRPIS